MGLTCAGIHVFVGESTDSQGAAAFDRIQEPCQQMGYMPMDGVPSESDLVGISTGSWLTLIRPTQAGIIDGALTSLAEKLSSGSGYPVLIAAVYDSDEFAFLLFENGQQVDGNATCDDLVPFRYKRWTAKQRAEHWSRIFGRSISLAEAKQLRRSPTLFADDSLAKLCALAGLPLEQGALTPRDLESTRKSQTRCFRHDDPEAANESTAIKQITLASHEHVSRDGDSSLKISLIPGEDVDEGFIITGPADGFHDPAIEFSGSAVEHELVNVTKLYGFCQSLRDKKLPGKPLATEVVERTSADGGRIIRAQLQGLPGPASDDSRREQLQLAGSFRFNGVDEGAGEVLATFFPKQNNAESLALKPAFHVEIRAPNWIPRDCESHIRDRVHHPLLLQDALRASRVATRQLNTPRTRLGVAILSGRDEQAFDPVPTYLEQWIRHQHQPPWHIKVEYEGQMNPTTFHIPKKKQRLQIADVGEKKWQRLFAKPNAIQSLFLTIVDDDSDAPFAGASVQRTFEDEDLEVAGTISLAFWTRCSEEKDHADVQVLTKLIDSAFETSIGLQGWVAAWDWTPRFTMGEENNYTPYEQAFAMDSPAVERENDADYMDETWCDRFLRGIGPRIWLGSSILERIDRERLEQISTSAAVGPSSIRLELPETAQLGSLEKVLIPVLPTSRVPIHDSND